MKKRMIALAMAAVLLAGMGSGCGYGKNTAAEETACYEEAPAEAKQESAGGNYMTDDASSFGKADYASAAEEASCYEEALTGAADGACYEEAPAEAETYNGVAGIMQKTKGSSEGGYAQSCYDWDYEQRPRNTEEYSRWEEKGFANVLKEPVSTFSADVDTASYSHMRRMITDGYRLGDFPRNSIRIEELLNYFHYDYPEPKGSEPFSVTTQLGECPWNPEAQLLMLGFKTQSIDYSRAPASNLVFLLDVSGSMSSADKLPLLQKSFATLTKNLTEKDRVSIVTYAGSDKVVLERVPGNKTSKILNALEKLKAGGCTNGSRGIMTAYQIAEENFIKGGNNRVILATDGDLNVGLTSQEDLEELISQKKESGIFLSVLGFGTGNLKDNKMETLADKGNGNYAYIDCQKEAQKVLGREMTATLLTICKDVKLQVEFNPAVVSDYRLIGYENRALNREDFNDDKKDAGEIGAGHSVTVLYELILREPLTAADEEMIRDLKYEKNYREALGESKDFGTAREQEWLTVSVRYKKPAEDTSSLLQYPVGFDSYAVSPSEDFVFAAAVAEFGLLAANSSQPGNASPEHVIRKLLSIDLNDEYKEEFLALVEEMR